MLPLISYVDGRAVVGATDAAAEEKADAMLDAISAELRGLTRRAFEGQPTIYDEVYRVSWARIFTLPHSPVTRVLAVRPVAFDGTEDAVLDVRDVAGGTATTLAAAAAAGATNLKVASVTGVDVGDVFRVGSGTALEVVRVTAVGTAGSGGTGLTIDPALRYAQPDGAALVEAAGSTRWLLELPRRGRVRLAASVEYARFTYVVSGEIPADVDGVVREWLKAAWEDETDDPVATQQLASQSSQDWAESYVVNPDPRIARSRPPSVRRIQLRYFHPSGPAGAPA